MINEERKFAELRTSVFSESCYTKDKPKMMIKFLCGLNQISKNYEKLTLLLQRFYSALAEKVRIEVSWSVHISYSHRQRDDDSKDHFFYQTLGQSFLAKDGKTRSITESKTPQLEGYDWVDDSCAIHSIEREGLQAFGAYAFYDGIRYLENVYIFIFAGRKLSSFQHDQKAVEKLNYNKYYTGDPLKRWGNQIWRNYLWWGSIFHFFMESAGLVPRWMAK